MSPVLEPLIALGLKYGGLILDVFRTLITAQAQQFTKEQVLAEVERIKAREAEQVASDWQTVKS